MEVLCLTEARDKLARIEIQARGVGNPTFEKYHAQYIDDLRDGLTARQKKALHLTRKINDKSSRADTMELDEFVR